MFYSSIKSPASSEEIKIIIKSSIMKNMQNQLNYKYDVYERSKGVNCNYKPFYFLAKKDKTIVGILAGYAAFSEVYIDDLLVMPDYRKQKIGTKLMAAVEEHFNLREFTCITLVTNQFQAVDFYKKCGYETEFVRKNPHIEEFTKYFFIKWLKYIPSINK